jgi:hypothetical protein
MRKSLLLLQAFVISALWIGHVAIAAVGRTEGAASVSDNGAATYTIPIFAPPGTAGLTPELAFVYSSNNGNGALGVGWGISGLSRIERCPSTFASNNGNPRDVKGDTLDRFCLDGNQLKYFAGSPYGQAGAEYRTELDTIARIKSYGSAGTGPAYFIVEQKNGLIYEYGNTSDSRIEWLGSANARTWAVNKIRDRSGNAVLFNYTEDGVNGGYRVSSIQYTANGTQGITPPYEISFVYESMPNGEVDSTFMGNGLIKRMTRLDRVDVAYSSSLVRRYELTFEPNLSSTSRSRLQSIQECSGPTLDCLPATVFTYQNGTNNQYSEYDTGVTVATGYNVVLPLDINGDGRTDLVYPSCPGGGGQGTWISSLANADGSYAPPVNSGLTAPCRLAVPIDYNADGRQDILYELTSPGPLYVLQGTAQGLATAAIDTGAPGTGFNPIVNAMDVNGDGVDDLVYVYQQSVQYRLRQFPSPGFGAPVPLHEIPGPSYFLP